MANSIGKKHHSSSNLGTTHEAAHVKLSQVCCLVALDLRQAVLVQAREASVHVDAFELTSAESLTLYYAALKGEAYPSFFIGALPRDLTTSAQRL